MRYELTDFEWAAIVGPRVPDAVRRPLRCTAESGLTKRWTRRLWGDRVEELLALGLPDWRAPALGAAITNVIERTSDEISAEDRAVLADFVRRLPNRFDDVDTCGLRDTLVHGDFHPGNFPGDGRALTLLDWGDSGVGHPLLDQAAFLDCDSERLCRRRAGALVATMERSCSRFRS